MKKIKEDFEKRYERTPENILFCGLPVIFAHHPGMTVGAGLSVGAYILSARRDDERVQLQFWNSNRMLCVNKEDLVTNHGGKICDILLGLQKFGGKLCGADILIYENTRFKFPKELLFMCAGNGFFDDLPQVCEMIKHTDNFEENLISVLSRKEHLVAVNGTKAEYLPFRNQQFKIVISHIDERLSGKDYAPPGDADGIKNALLSEDITQFGQILNHGTEILFKKCRAKRTQALFEIAKECADCVGSGVFRQGGIFSVVENDRVDTFIRNLGCVYEKHIGGRPDFYITKPEDGNLSIK